VKLENFGATLKASDLSKAIVVNSSALNNDTLKDFTARKAVVEKIMSDIISKQNLTINVNLKDVNADKEKVERFIIELVPRLREVGASLAITNNSILSESFIQEMGL